MHFLLPGGAGRRRRRLRALRGLAQAGSVPPPSSPPLHVARPVSLSRDRAGIPSPWLRRIQALLMLLNPITAEIQRSSEQPQHVNGAPSIHKNQTWNDPPEGRFLPLIYEWGCLRQLETDGLRPETLSAVTNPGNLYLTGRNKPVPEQKASTRAQQVALSAVCCWFECHIHKMKKVAVSLRRMLHHLQCHVCKEKLKGGGESTAVTVFCLFWGSTELSVHACGWLCRKQFSQGQVKWKRTNLLLPVKAV